MENKIKQKKLIQALIKEEMDPRRPKDKAFDLAQQLSKLSPEDREKVAMIQQMISKEREISGIEDDEMETRYDYDDPIFENYTKQSLLKALGSADDALIQTHVSPGEKGEGDYRLDGQEYVIYNPNSNNDDNAAMWNSDDYVVALDKDGEEYEIAYADIMRINMDEGSCGYGPDGVPGNTPGETKGMPADDRTRGMLKKLIQREIAKYENK